jgi:hypothetical protein
MDVYIKWFSIDYTQTKTGTISIRDVIAHYHNNQDQGTYLVKVPRHNEARKV